MRAASAAPAKVLAVVVPVCLAGATAVAVAAVLYGRAPRTGSDVAALTGLLACMILAERFPVPVEGLDSGGVTLGREVATEFGEVTQRVARTAEVVSEIAAAAEQQTSGVRQITERIKEMR
mgnify:CR=1 FL=1